MDNIFDIYSAKVDNDKDTEWDLNLFFPDWYALTNPLDYRLCLSTEIWSFHTITDYYCHKGAFKTVKIPTNTLSFAEIWLFHTITDYYCYKGAFKTLKMRTNTLSFAVRA